MSTISTISKTLALVGVSTILGGGLFIYSGILPIGADVPHHPATYWLLETAREQSVKRAAESIVVPANLNSANRLLAGGADYNDMCAQCHLKPGTAKTDFSIGLYPAPPNLLTGNTQATGQHPAQADKAALQRQFWIIKHGIKASGMPAWGPTHSDERIWNMVAFLQQLPKLTPEQYQILSARQGLEEDGAHH